MFFEDKVILDKNDQRYEKIRSIILDCHTCRSWYGDPLDILEELEKVDYSFYEKQLDYFEELLK